MSMDKNELRYLMTELKKVFASKPDLEALRDVINEDLLDFDPNVTYMGSEEPDNDNVIWFDTGESAVNEITFDNPIISELFACIRTLQDQVQQLQADVEYLKLYGGGGGGSIPDRPPTTPDTDTTVESYLILEDGGMFLMEDGSSFLLENSEVNIKDSVLSLENGGLFLLENGGYLILENTIESISSSLLLLENGANALLENGGSILLENQ